MAIFPEDKLAEIRNSVDIVELISERVVLKKAGKDHIGLCPFHSEKTPSFTVSPLKQIYHCFGCGAGGDAFSFLMKQDGIEFPEAVQVLARRSGIELPERVGDRRQRGEHSDRQRLFELNMQVMKFYRSRLGEGPAGKNASAYLSGRGFNKSSIDRFCLGYAPDGWDGLVDFFRKNRVSADLAGKSGLVVPKKAGGYYDRFRNRIIFPIFDVTGRVIAFGGRVLDDSLPKYLNSPETLLYNKGRTLYGVQAAKAGCRESGCVYIVEGYFDLIALHQHGVTNAVATLGTALTPAHVKLLQRGFAERVYLVFDSDQAGIRAAERSMPIFINESVNASVIVLPDGYDPDSYVFEFGPESFRERTDNAQGMIDFLIESAVASHGLSMEGKVRIITQLAPLLGQIDDGVAKSLHIRHLSERLEVDESAVIERVKTAAGQAARISGRNAPKAGAGIPGGPAESADAGSHPARRLEKQVISMMLKCGEILPVIENRGILDYIEDDLIRSVGYLILKHPPSEDGDITELMNHLTDPRQQTLVASLAIEDLNWDTEEARWDTRYCKMLIDKLKKSKSQEKAVLLKQIKAAEESNNREILTKLLKQKQDQSVKRY